MLGWIYSNTRKIPAKKQAARHERGEKKALSYVRDEGISRDRVPRTSFNLSMMHRM